MAAPVTLPRVPLRPLQKAGLIIGLLVFLLPFFISIPGLNDASARMLSIFLLAVVFWVTEALPLFATATVIMLLEVLLISSSALLPVTDDAPSVGDVFSAFGNPVIVLFMGGFFIANGAAKYGLDKNLAAVFIKPFAASPRRLIMGFMLITAVLGMFMSNTATTATMFAVAMPVLAAVPHPRARTALALSIPLAANIGGMSTPVGTPPNAIAVAALANQGIQVSFVQWMMMAAPVWIPLIVLAWFIVTRWVPKDLEIDLALEAKFDKSLNAKIFYAVTALTIILWMTEPFHGISSNIVGFIPVVLLLSTRVMTGKDIQLLDWPVLWLVAGGIALGDGIANTGLDKWILGLFDWEGMAPTLVIVVLAFVTLGLGAVISNSAIANLVVPLAISFAVVVGVDAVVLAVLLALAASLGMPLPISTPPNAIAYSTGFVSVKDMAIVGVIIGVIGALMLSLLMPWAWGVMGLV